MKDLNIDNLPRMKSRMWTKRQTQATLRDLRTAGLPVTKIDSGYEVRMKKDKVIFEAMIGNSGYLVRYDERLFG